MKQPNTKAASAKSTPLLLAYEHFLNSGGLTADAAQRRACETLQTLQSALTEQFGKSTGILKKIIGKQGEVKGIYLHGPVGRGKSMLMDLFFDTLAITQKRRVHFHAFMQEVHARLHTLRKKNQEGDPLPEIAKEIARNTRVLCFDELQISDITDAMLVGRLFDTLFEQEVVVIATSNRAPEDLYKDGLQRENFLPFIALIKERSQVLALDGGKDYRLTHLKALKTTYFTPLGKKADAFLEQTFRDLTQGAKPKPCTLTVGGRKLTITRSHGDIAWASFPELCAAALGPADYIEIAREFNTLLLADIPLLTPENRNEAKRFVTLVDELYEHKVNLICTAAGTPERLYVKGTGSFEFERTVSRLVEMQSERYLSEEHIA